MSQTYEFYTEQADRSAAEARAAKLDNVRERALRSEKTWRTLADQARAVATRRARLEREKAATREQERAAEGENP